MSPLTQAHFDETLERYARLDPELYRELRGKLSQPSEEAVAGAALMINASDELLVSEVGEATGLGRSVVETVVRPNARPVLTIRDNRATTEFLGPDSEVWAGRIREAQSVLDRVIPSIGRVEVNNNPDFTWVGTGWLVAGDIIVTNRHVAREFGRRGTAGFSFRAGINGGPMTSRIDFLEEDQRTTSMEYAVNSILWIAPPDEADVAFLRVTRLPSDRPLPPPVALAGDVAADEFVATIGYPARDSRVPDQDLVRRIFGDVYDKKRLAPGQVIEAGDDELEHDCSTLGGNSGSAVIRLRTGEAVGLHFSGLFLEANFAVSSRKVRDLLRRVQQGELPGAINVRTASSGASAAPSAAPAQGPGAYTFQLQVPIEITVKVGAPGASAAPGSGDSVESALSAAREALASDPDVIEVRAGYRFKRGWITDERVIVVEVREKVAASKLAGAGKRTIPAQFMGVGVDVRTAALPEQLEHVGVSLSALEARSRPGRYREPANLSLEPVRERMKAVFHVSPDSGFPNLREFLGRVRRHLTATMYEWDPNHISDAIEDAIAADGRTLTMVTQKNTPAGGTRRAVEDMRERFKGMSELDEQGRRRDKFEHVWASVGAGNLIPSAYHIKVASRDGEEVWLSSGNWKDSNQADIDPAGEDSTSMAPLREHNREWHAVIENRKLARLFQKYIEFDFSEARRVPLEEGLDVALPDLFVPEAAFMEGFERRVKAEYFDPLELDRELEIQPLLTPDRGSRGDRLFMAHALKMIGKGTRRIYVENQSFNLLEGDDNQEEFEQFFTVLRDKQQAGVDVRVIFRDGREFGHANAVSQQKLLERLKEFGFDTSESVRVQRRCHTKGIIVDASEVMIGSHNLTNAGSLFNRDASLLVRDAEVAAYFERIFLFDWEVLATQEADELVGGVRVAQPGEETPAGFRRVSAGGLLGGGGPPRHTSRRPAPAPDKKYVVITSGQPEVWSREQAHYLLARMRLRVWARELSRSLGGG